MIKMKQITSDSDYTECFLQKISSRLSSRDECRQVEYLVTVSDDGCVDLQPKDYIVYPNRYCKQKGAHTGIVSHTINLPDMQSLSCKYHLVPGKYIYKLSINKKRRKWCRIN